MPAPHYEVLFDGTPHCPMGRQLSVAEEVRRPAPPVMVGTPKFHTELPKRVLAHLETGDYTLIGLASRLRESPERVHKAIFGLMKRGLVEVVGIDTNRDPLPGQHVRVSIYGVRG